MKNNIIIKGNKYGISIVLNPDADFSKIKEDLKGKLSTSENLFENSKPIAVAFEGRVLTNDELDSLISLIQENSRLNIQYIIDNDHDTEQRFNDYINNNQAGYTVLLNETDNSKYGQEPVSDYEQNIPETVQKAYDSSSGMFYKGTLRSGQKLESDNSIVILGDVNPGASVIAGGNIVIIGSLTGSVCAGARGNRNCFVMALSMSPIQIQIADIIARSSDKKSFDKKSFDRLFNKKSPEKKSTKQEAMIATVIEDHIYVENISKAALSDLIIWLLCIILILFILFDAKYKLYMEDKHERGKIKSFRKRNRA